MKTTFKVTVEYEDMEREDLKAEIAESIYDISGVIKVEVE